MSLLCLIGWHRWYILKLSDTGAFRDSDVWRTGPADQPLVTYGRFEMSTTPLS